MTKNVIHVQNITLRMKTMFVNKILVKLPITEIQMENVVPCDYDKNCKTCKKAGSCEKCKDGDKLIKNGKCVPIKCGKGKYRLKNGDCGFCRGGYRCETCNNE